MSDVAALIQDEAIQRLACAVHGDGANSFSPPRTLIKIDGRFFVDANSMMSAHRAAVDEMRHGCQHVDGYKAEVLVYLSTMGVGTQVKTQKIEHDLGLKKDTLKRPVAQLAKWGFVSTQRGCTGAVALTDAGAMKRLSL
jgi:predicted DNA-binding transcriptional regulator